MWVWVVGLSGGRGNGKTDLNRGEVRRGSRRGDANSETKDKEVGSRKIFFGCHYWEFVHVQGLDRGVKDRVLVLRDGVW